MKVLLFVKIRFTENKTKIKQNLLYLLCPREISIHETVIFILRDHVYGFFFPKISFDLLTFLENVLNGLALLFCSFYLPIIGQIKNFVSVFNWRALFFKRIVEFWETLLLLASFPPCLSSRAQVLHKQKSIRSAETLFNKI